MITGADICRKYLRIFIDYPNSSFGYMFVSNNYISDTGSEGAMKDFIGFLTYFNQAKDAFEIEYGRDITNRIEYLLKTNPVLFSAVGGNICDKLPFLEIIKLVCSKYGLTYPFTGVSGNKDENSEE